MRFSREKTQGSEFDDVMMILPDQMYEVLSRELLYTALTRARKYLEI
jgi:exodeoxyribonuclease V alpha subunit